MGLKFHPSIVVNNVTFQGDVSGEKLAWAICATYKEKPDECDLSWRIKAFTQGVLTSFDDLAMPSQEDYIVEAA